MRLTVVQQLAAAIFTFLAPALQSYGPFPRLPGGLVRILSQCRRPWEQRQMFPRCCRGRLWAGKQSSGGLENEDQNLKQPFSVGSINLLPPPSMRQQYILNGMRMTEVRRATMSTVTNGAY